MKKITKGEGEGSKGYWHASDYIVLNGFFAWECWLSDYSGWVVFFLERVKIKEAVILNWIFFFSSAIHFC